MIRLPETIYVATTPVNLRLSFDRLAGIVREVLGHDPRGEAVFVFHNRCRTHVKILWHDRRGYCLVYKRLDRGVFRIPLAVPPGCARVSISRRELDALFEGVDTALLRRARQVVREHAAASA
ncbi:MAG: IS66 family insertion sequence element accessory protein TnpB [Polyangiaceae bacterium]|nr:IS66 family insertion sequence element accessory protein TnpB [Polyangiaceae bacterium]